MTEKVELTPEQQRIAEMMGTSSVLEELLTTILVTGIEDGTYSREQIEARLTHIRASNEVEPENTWGERYQSGAIATVSRIGGMIGINGIIANAIASNKDTD